MSDINIPAVASGAFLGFLALLCIVACVPPVTRFLGDLFCCPWRIPFTKKKRRNGDEEVEQSDFPYLAGKNDSEHLDASGNHEESHRMSAAYMSAVSLVDPEHSKEEWLRSIEYRRSGEYRMGLPPNHDHRQSFYASSGPHQTGYHSNSEMTMHQLHDDHYASQHLQVPGQQQHGNWRQPSPDRLMQQRSANTSPERHHNYPPQQPGSYYHGEDYSPDHYPNDYYAESYVDVQRPPPSHVHTPPEVQQHSYLHGYFPQPEWEQEEYHQYSHGSSSSNNNNNRPHASSERLMGPTRQQFHNV